MFNWVKTAMLMAAIMALFGIVGGMLGGQQGMLLALLFGGAMNVFSYWFSDKMVLKMYNAREVDETSAPRFYGMVRDLAQRADLPMPRVYLIDEQQPGRRHQRTRLARECPGNPDPAGIAILLQPVTPPGTTIPAVAHAADVVAAALCGPRPVVEHRRRVLAGAPDVVERLFRIERDEQRGLVRQ